MTADIGIASIFVIEGRPTTGCAGLKRLMKRGVFEQGIEQPDQKVKIHTPVLSRQTLVECGPLDAAFKRCSVNY